MNSLSVLNLLAVALGAAAGGVLRWVSGLWLSVPGSWLPLGTVAVNCVGGWLIGLSMVWFAREPQETLRLLCVTGFLGGFTTFSTFSSESLSLLHKGQVGLALAHSLIHVLGALVFTVLGFKLGRWTWGV
jgi:CrcB protein